MSAEKKRKGSNGGRTKKMSESGQPDRFRAVTYARMQILDLEFLAVRKLMSDPTKFHKVKKVLQEAITEVRNIQWAGLRPCNGHECELDEHCMQGECVFGPPRGEETS